MVLMKQLSINGFIVTSLHAQYNTEFLKEIPPKVASGELKYVDDVKHGLESAGQTIVDVLTGKNLGKPVIVVADE